MKNYRNLIAVCAVALLFVGAVLTWTLFTRSTGGDAQRSFPPSRVTTASRSAALPTSSTTIPSVSVVTVTTTSRPALTGGVAASFAADLESGNAKRLAEVVDLPSGQAIDSAVLTEFAKLAPINVDQATFRSTGPNTAKVVASVGAAATKWTLFLVWRADHWALATTTPGAHR